MKNFKKAGAYILAISIASTSLLTPTYADSDLYKLNNSVNGYINASDANYGLNKKTTYSKGDYYIYKEFDGMYNISKTKNSPGVWINPSDNKNTISETKETIVEQVKDKEVSQITTSDLKTGDKITLVNTLKTYINASDAKNGVNVRGAYGQGDYYIYKIYNGIYNISKTKGLAGAWVNLDNNVIRDNADSKSNSNVKEEEEKVNKNLLVRYVSASVNVRQEARTSSTKLGKLSKGTKIEGVYVGSWFKFTYNGKTAYVYSTYITDKAVTSAASNPTNSNSEDKKDAQIPLTSSKLGQSIADMARKYKGYRYIYGHSDPNTGFDCSGLVLYVLNHHGISMPRSAKAQYSMGKSVSYDSMQAGDLIFFGETASTIYHVAIYLGDGTMVHASNPTNGVKIDSAYSNWVKNNMFGVKRISE